MSTIFTIQSAALPPTAHVTAFVGRESISRPYEIDIAFKVIGVDIDVAGAVGARATLTIDRGPGSPPFVFHGVLASVELVNDFESYGLYLARLAPALFQLSLTHHSRIFTDNSIPTIIEAVLKDSGVSDFRFTLSQGYPALEHVCQYRESNLDFISRLMEREGIYYYFEQGDDREVMVITDTKAAHTPLAPKAAKYYPSPLGDISAGESIRSFKCKSQVLPARVRLKDYNYLKPSLDVSGTAPVANGPGDIVMYGENFQTPKEGARYATVRAEELLAQQTVFTGSGYQFYLRPGYTFALDDHPRPAFNAEYTAVEVEHVGNQSATPEELDALFGVQGPEVYTATVHAIPKDVQYRAPRRTEWPRIYGVVDGTVDGAGASPYAQIDAHGRYRVRIFFDESDLVDGSASTWVRMLQPHGGSVEGHHFPLRKGTEVHMVFLGGDPDRPVIAGVAHNAQKPSVVTQANFTKNMIRTGSNNYIEMEDMAGGTYVHVYAPQLNSSLHLGAGGKNFDLTTDGEGRIHTGASLEVDVDANKTEDVRGTVTETYCGPFDTTVENAVEQTYQSTLKLDVTGATTVHYQSTLDYDVDAAATEDYHATRDLTVTGAATEKYTSSLDVTVDGFTTEKFNAGHLLNVKGGQTVDVKGDQTVTITSNKTETINGIYDLKVTGNLVTSINGNQTVKTSGPVQWFNEATFSGFTYGDRYMGHFGTSLMLFAGAKADISVAISTELAIALKVNLFALEFEIAGPKVEALAAKLLSAGARLDQVASKIGMGGAEVKINGVNLFL